MEFQDSIKILWNYKYQLLNGKWLELLTSPSKNTGVVDFSRSNFLKGSSRLLFCTLEQLQL